MALLEGMGLVAAGHKPRTDSSSAGGAHAASQSAGDANAANTTAGVEDASSAKELVSTPRREESSAPVRADCSHGDSSSAGEAALRLNFKQIRRGRLEAILGESLLGRDRYRTVATSPLEWMLGKVPEHKFAQALSLVTSMKKASARALWLSCSLHTHTFTRYHM